MAEAAYVVAGSLEEALALAETHSGHYAFAAGGTDLQLRRQQELEAAPLIIDLSGIGDLGGVRAGRHRLEIGALTTLAELATSAAVRRWCPMIAEAAASIGTPVLRMTATAGGNLLVANRCTWYNQSAAWRGAAGTCLRNSGDTCLVTGGCGQCYSRAVSDLAPALIALQARVVLRDAHATREAALEDLYLADGLHPQAQPGKDAILTALRLAHRPERWCYRKLRRRDSVDYTSLTVAGARDADGGVRVCIGGVSMSPILVSAGPGDANLPALTAEARRKCKTVDNDLLPLSYRRNMIDVFLEELWRELGENGHERRTGRVP